MTNDLSSVVYSRAFELSQNSRATSIAGLLVEAIEMSRQMIEFELAAVETESLYDEGYRDGLEHALSLLSVEELEFALDVANIFK